MLYAKIESLCKEKGVSIAKVMEVGKKKKKKASKAVRTPKKPVLVDVTLGDKVIYRVEIQR